MERDKALDMALGQIEKQFGKGSIMRMGEHSGVAVDAVSTGAMALDLALGIGGLPRGRIVEIFGPESSGKSTLAMHVVAEAQRNGGICAYIDAEHAMDPVYAKAIGLDIDELLISQPDTGEQGLEIADMLVRSGAIDVIVIDSVAALTPRAEIEGEMGDSHVGLQARLMSQALRKLTGTLSKSRTIAVFINQLREKIGVLYGCFSYDSRVTLADGTQEKIGRIVEEKLPVEVLSYDADAGGIVPRRVVNWYDNGPTDEFLGFAVTRPDGTGPSRFSATRNHLIRTPGGWREAGHLEAGERVLHIAEAHLSDFQLEVLRGALMGSAGLSSGGGASVSARWRHRPEQAGYASWKRELFANVGTTTSPSAPNGTEVSTRPLAELSELYESVYVGAPGGHGVKSFSDDYLKRVGPLGLALWYQEDFDLRLENKAPERPAQGPGRRAGVCVSAMTPGTQERVLAWLAETWGIGGMLVKEGDEQEPHLVLTTEGTATLQALVAPFVHPELQDKLPAGLRGRFAAEPVFSPPRRVLRPARIERVEAVAPTAEAHRFDIEIEGTHNYFVDGVMVHNSPETTPGGRALKFYSSVRLDIRRIESIKEGGDLIGNRTRVKVVKNKCVAAGTKVFDPSTGTTHAIEEIVDGGAARAVVSADKSGRLHHHAIEQRFVQGEAEVIGLGLGDGTTLWVTPDHRVLTDDGWCEAGELEVGDRLARPRRYGSFGRGEPVTPEQARLLGYLLGGGYVTGGTRTAVVKVDPQLREDAAATAAALGCEAVRLGREGVEATLSCDPGGRNLLSGLCREAGMHGRRTQGRRVPERLFAEDVSAEVLGNLVLGLFEAAGRITRERGGLRAGFVTGSEQLAHQVHWLLLRWGVGSSVRSRGAGSGRSGPQSRQRCWEVRVSGLDNVRRLAEAVPTWGPRGRELVAALSGPEDRCRRGSQRGYLPAGQTLPVLAYLRERGVTPAVAASLTGVGAPASSLRRVLGVSRLRRDRLERLADALDSPFLRGVLEEEVWYDRVAVVHPARWRDVYDIEVAEDHTFVADDVVVSNCAPPFKQAEFDIVYGKGISREGSVLDVAVDFGIVKKSGAWYTYEGEQLGQGRENAKQFLRSSPEMMVELDQRIREVLEVDAAEESPEQAESFDARDDEPISLG